MQTKQGSHHMYDMYKVQPRCYCKLSKVRSTQTKYNYKQAREGRDSLTFPVFPVGVVAISGKEASLG